MLNAEWRNGHDTSHDDCRRRSCGERRDERRAAAFGDDEPPAVREARERYEKALREADARRREFVTLRAVGATKTQLAWMLTKTAVKTAAVGIAAGLPVGALVGWLFTFKTGAMWPGLPHYFVVPVRLVAEGALGALVFALVFAVPTALALVRRATRR